jgi:PIN domain nuclease of toxin-antitoxin system
VLLDTHLVLWWLSGDPRLPQLVVQRLRVDLPEDVRHRDPFDRLLVCQSRVEPMLLLSVDRQVERYGASVMVGA